MYVPAPVYVAVPSAVSVPSYVELVPTRTRSVPMSLPVAVPVVANVTPVNTGVTDPLATVSFVPCNSAVCPAATAPSATFDPADSPAAS